MSRRYRPLAVLLFFVLMLDWADRGMVGAIAPELRRDFHIGNTDIGLLVTAVTIVAAIATIPFGMVTDRVRRVRLLAVVVAVWSLALVMGGLVTTFAMLLVSRLVLGASAAASGPTVPSLVGDMTPRQRRGRLLGWIDSGQLVGNGLSYLVGAAAVALGSWRIGFVALGLLGIGVSVQLWRSGEPERERVRRRNTDEEADVPVQMSLWQATRHVLRVRTFRVAIIASAIGSYFFAGTSTFAVVYVTDRFHLSTAAADIGVVPLGIGAVAGFLVGARLGDRLQDRGVENGRLRVAIVGFTGAAVFAVPALLTSSMVFAAIMITLGVTFLSASTPTLDAVRIDVIPPRLRGRAEAVRTVVRTAAEGAAPAVFGIASTHLAGGGEAGLQLAFLITLPALALNGLLLMAALPSYARDAARAVEEPEQRARRLRRTRQPASTMP